MAIPAAKDPFPGGYRLGQVNPWPVNRIYSAGCGTFS